MVPSSTVMIYDGLCAPQGNPFTYRKISQRKGRFVWFGSTREESARLLFFLRSGPIKSVPLCLERKVDDEDDDDEIVVEKKKGLL